MTDPKNPKPKSATEREARLAEALRQNLKRRKDQARGREAETSGFRNLTDRDADN